MSNPEPWLGPKPMAPFELGQLLSSAEKPIPITDKEIAISRARVERIQREPARPFLGIRPQYRWAAAPIFLLIIVGVFCWPAEPVVSVVPIATQAPNPRASSSADWRDIVPDAITSPSSPFIPKSHVKKTPKPSPSPRLKTLGERPKEKQGNALPRP